MQLRRLRRVVPRIVAEASAIGAPAAILLTASTISLPLMAQPSEGVLARCGASEGQGYFFQDDLMLPDGPEWLEDGIPSGQLVLIRLGEEWDIQFDDTAGAYGYRQDGAQVFALGNTKTMLTIGAFRGTYVDTFTFNFAGGEVVWTSHKIDTLVRKVGIYRAECDFVADAPN